MPSTRAQMAGLASDIVWAGLLARSYGLHHNAMAVSWRGRQARMYGSAKDARCSMGLFDEFRVACRLRKR